MSDRSAFCIRVLARALLALLLVACGGGDTVSPNTPPSSSSIPASVTVSTGNNQEAEPGSALPVSPAVLVRDAAGRALAGIEVTFTVDSGGGTIARTTATTGNDGVANAGAWTIGPQEGRNIMSARVGTLPAAKFVATASFLSVTLADVSIGPSGSTIVVNKAGSPFNGLRLDVPPGAYSGSVHFKIGSASSKRLTLTGGALVVGPLLVVETDAELSSAPLTLHVPASIGTAGFPVVAIVDTLKGALEVLATLEYDATSVTATLRSFDAPIATALSRRFGFGPPKRVSLAVLVLPQNVMNGDVDTGFRPGTDDWDFPEVVTTHYNQIGSGMVVSERWYYRAIRPAGPPLNGRSQLARGVWESNQGGIRWSSLISERFDEQATSSISSAQGKQHFNKASYDANTLRSIVAAMLLTGQPQIVGLRGIDPLFPGGRTDDKVVLAYRSQGGSLLVADPWFSGDASRAISFTSQGMAPYVANNFTYGVAVAGLNHIVPDPNIAADWPGVVSGTVGQNFYPSLNLKSWDPIINDTLFMLGDTSRFWFTCKRQQGDRPGPGGCPIGQPTTLPVGQELLQRQHPVFEERPAGWQSFPLANTIVGVTLDLVSLNRPGAGQWTDMLLGVATHALLPLLDPILGPSQGYAGWRTLRVIRFGIGLGQVTGTQGTPVTMSIQLLGGPSLPAQSTFRWNFNDGTPTVVSTTVSVNHTFANTGAYPVEVDLVHPNGTVIARTRSTALIEIPLVLWRLDSVGVSKSGNISNPSRVDTAYHNHIVRAINALAASPGDNHVIVSGNRAILQQVPIGQGGSVRGVVLPPNSILFGLADPDDSFTMGPVGNGVLSGEFWIGTDPLDPTFYHLKNTIAANMTPGFLRGTFSLMAWRDSENGAIVYTVTFRAVQVVN